MLIIKNLAVQVQGLQILHDISISIFPGQIHALMGPNGSGKSTLAGVIMGCPEYHIVHGDILLDQKSISNFSIHERAKIGLFLAFQYPCALSGVQVFSFLQEAYRAVGNTIHSIDQFLSQVKVYMEILGIDESFLYRDVNVGFSGGEKKRLEILQLLLLKPAVAILDEIDSGLDVDALQMVAKGLLYAKEVYPQMSIIIITHYTRILQYIHPDQVHILVAGSIKKSGIAQLAHTIDQRGYDEYHAG